MLNAGHNGKIQRGGARRLLPIGVSRARAGEKLPVPAGAGPIALGQGCGGARLLSRDRPGKSDPCQLRGGR